MNDLAKPIDKESNETQRIGAMLVAKGKLNAKDIVAVARTQTQQGLRFGEAAVQLGLVARADVNAVLAEQFAYTLPPAQGTRLDPRLTMLFQPASTQAEAIRSLRSELLVRQVHPHPQQPLAVIGCDASAEIALTTANLAIGFAQLGHRTLLLDTNLRDAPLNTLFGLHPHAPGLSDRLAGRHTLAPIPVAEVPSLWLMPAGTRAPNPQELLSGNRYRNYLSHLQQLFDLVLISTGSMTVHSDAQVVAVQARAALMLAHTHQTRTQTLARVCQRLGELGVRLVGTALYQ